MDLLRIIQTQSPLFWLGFLSPPGSDIFDFPINTGPDYNSVDFGKSINYAQIGTIPPLIPRDVLFGVNDYEQVQLSPDGRFLSYISESSNSRNVFVADLADALRGSATKGRPITRESGRGVAGYTWLYDNRTIIFAQDEGGNENYRLTTVNVETGRYTQLTNGSTVKAEIMSLSRFFPNRIVIGLNDRDPRYHDLYLLDITNGQRRLLMKNDRFVDVIFDQYLQPKLTVEIVAGNIWQYYTRQGDAWQLYRSVPSDDSENTQPLQFDLSGRKLYWKDSVDRDKTALVETDFRTKSQRVLFTPKRADLSSVEFDPTTETPVAVSVNYDRVKWVPLDPGVQVDIQYLRGISTGDMFLVDKSLDFNIWLVVYINDNEPRKYYLYERKSRKATFLFPNNKQLSRYPLAKMYPMEIRTRDNLTEVCYLTLPLESDPSGTGRPNRPLPMVLNVHGGPNARDYWGYSSEVQFFANRGYAVLNCNYRQSTGYGKNFIKMGIREWGRKMHMDLIDAINVMKMERIADPTRIAIFGYSYGGYATLVGLTFTPDAFACGVDAVGSSNLITLLRSLPSYWLPAIESTKVLIGDPDTAEGLAMLRSRSPLFFADRIKKPLLIAQGANDPRVKQAEADQIVQAMQKANLPITYILFPDEGHGFRKPENQKAFYAVVEQFLRQCLGGRAQSIANTVEASSMQVIQDGDLSQLKPYKINE